MRRRNVTVLGYDGVRLMDVTAPLEVFGTAERLGGAYTLTLCSPTGAPVTTSAGTRLLVDAAATEIDGAHTLVVPGSVDFPQHAPAAELLDAVSALAATSGRIASVCTGAFLLAGAGLLDGRRAVTHWRHAAMLARRHPSVSVEPDAIFVRDDTVYTSAGVTAGIDLALALVEADEGADLAREVARDLVVFLRRPGGQSQFSVPSRARAGADDPLRPVLDAVAADPAADHSLPALARLGGFSPATSLACSTSGSARPRRSMWRPCASRRPNPSWPPAPRSRPPPPTAASAATSPYAEPSSAAWASPPPPTAPASAAAPAAEPGRKDSRRCRAGNGAG